MPKFLVEMTATKIVEVNLTEDDMEKGETDIEEAAANLAGECAFHNSYPDMVSVVEDWDLTVEEVKAQR